MTETRLRLVLSLLAFPLVGACREKKPVPAPVATAYAAPEVEAPAAPSPDDKAMEAYRNARDFVRASDPRGARQDFLLAVRLKPDFTEAWYNLGAATTELAMEEARVGNDEEAVSLFREAVEAKRRAQTLIDDGKWWVYLRTEEQEQVKDDLRNALEDADEVLADEHSLLAALRMMSHR